MNIIDYMQKNGFDAGELEVTIEISGDNTEEIKIGSATFDKLDDEHERLYTITIQSYEKKICFFDLTILELKNIRDKFTKFIDLMEKDIK